MRQLPIGIQDFQRIREKELYYVDKSMMIAEVLEGNPCGVTLFTRPRRFGKSLNLSMLDAFFNIKYKGNTWFDGLKISEHHEYDGYRNAYPIVSFDFKELEAESYENFIDKMWEKIHSLYWNYSYLKDSPALSESLRSVFADSRANAKNVILLESALSVLVQSLSAHHCKKVVVLIDEYDKPMNDSYGTGISDNVRTFMKTVLSSLLKGNNNVEFAVITGVMQIAKESIFSGLNNLEVNNILSEGCDESFGFTDREVQAICEDYGHPEKYAEAKEWYDGYRFGNADIYNPWSVLKYVKSGFKPAAYWASTSGNDIIPTLLKYADMGVLEDLAMVGEGKSLPVKIDPSVAYKDLTSSKSAFYSVLAMSGYLKVTANGPKTMMSIPNKELRDVFANELLCSAGADISYISDFINALTAGDANGVASVLNDMLNESTSVRILDSEHVYQAFVDGLLMCVTHRYHVTCDYESGNGYSDLKMESLDARDPNIVIEFKKARDGDNAQSLAMEALQQIHNKDYCHGLKGKTMAYGIAFFGKTPAISSDVITHL